MTWNQWVVAAALNGLLSVAAGAFGAHGLKERVSERMLEAFETGARYQMYHAIALIAVAWLVNRSAGPVVQASGWFMLAGIVLFSGSLYAMALTGAGKLGMITPIGGVSMIVGWALLAWAAIRATG